jgi:predicted ATP-binding protein involved in virulence
MAIKTRIDDGEPVALPILAYYGTERGQLKPVERRRNFNDVFPRWDIYKADSLDSATDFKRFFTWYERNEDLERREQIQRKDWQYRSHVLNAVRSALEQLFPHLKHPRVETSPLRFVMDNVTDPQNPIEERIERMSDGYRITVALVADIAARMAEANPSVECSGLEDPLQTSGIVLIDEIDLHLHPTLQRDILRRLHSIFPNVQFVVSTHSPNVVIAALDIVQIVKIEQGRLHTDVRTQDYENYDISLLLLSDLFSVDSVRTADYKQLNSEYETLLAIPTLTEEQRRRIDQLAVRLNRFTSVDLENFRSTLSKLAPHD